MMNLSVLLPMAVETVRDPRTVADRLMGLNLSREILWQALALVVVVSILLAEVGNILLTSMSGMSAPAFFVSPLRMGLIQLSLLVLVVFAVFWFGRACGGTGRFQDGLVLVVWLQFMMVCLQVLQTLAILVFPALAWIIGIFGLVLFLWLLTNFIAIAHGFKSHAKVFLMIVASSFGFAFGLSLILALIGVSVPGVE
ncbi:Yip1 family protein [Oceaniovalibus sp. ACAM 378]|uniref:Yip1 family protein n=1 Tax=Oceaniovalibus sp. ACAM 378 TaxID=2599923 RepID=UPI0011DB8CEA|nr:Yip1 family protein [Oceaniovalibus sp. ACAM 378]TYB91052.1 YIP1 family protein [Oceaniovalibus sp. ACAM 378]